uniref:Kazal-like domain-containing protein n=1 Tax=Meloidogyne floridensis TaxID=298350 RepID=A0A915NLX2_9BILA
MLLNLFLIKLFIKIFGLFKILFVIFVDSIDVSLLDCSCQRSFHPVCGTDRQTYDSLCLLDCARRYDPGISLSLAYEGTCCPSADLCADYFDPVCDQFGNFYANDCIFDFHKCAQRRSGGPLIIIEGRGEQACANAIAAAAAKQQTKN